MELTNLQFLQALRAALRNEQVNWNAPVDWPALFRLAEQHRVLPLVYEAVYASPAAHTADPELMAMARRKTIQTVMLQAAKTDDFLKLYAHLRAQGLTPLVVKGIVCRSLYSRPDHRISADEDLLIPTEQLAACKQAMADFGMQTPNPDQPGELPYRKPDSPLYIELHTALFSPESAAYGDLNRFFMDAGAVPMTVQGCELLTLPPTDHLFYLICHSLKHFLHSGFGIRQVCDIAMFANAYGAQLDWQHLLETCRAIHAERFAAAIFKIGEKYLNFDPDQACWPAAWRTLTVDCGPMLADLLDAGIYGDATMTRKHSAMMTLSAAAAQKQGRRRSGLVASLFPPAAALSARYPYLRQKPWLLPVAWTERLLKYGAETRKIADNDAASSIRLGNRRIALLREYGLLPEN